MADQRVNIKLQMFLVIQSQISHLAVWRGSTVVFYFQVKHGLPARPADRQPHIQETGVRPPWEPRPVVMAVGEDHKQWLF